MVHSGFRGIGNLSFSDQFLKKWHRLASTASDRKSAKIQHDISWFIKNYFLFKTSKYLKLNSRIWMTLWTSVVIIQPWKLCSLNDLNSLNDLSGLNDLGSLNSSKNLLILMVGSFVAPKWPNMVPFCGINHQKSNFSLMSVEASWCYFFKNWPMHSAFTCIYSNYFKFNSHVFFW